MPPLTFSELLPESLHGGDTIEYYSQAFICGDAKGYRIARIARIDQSKDEHYPIEVEPMEKLPRSNFMRRFADRFGNRFKFEYVKWRTLRSYKLIDGEVIIPSQAHQLKATLRLAIEPAYAVVAQQLRTEGANAVDAISVALDLAQGVGAVAEKKLPSTCISAPIPSLVEATDATNDVNGGSSKVSSRSDAVPEVVNLISESESDFDQVEQDNVASPSTSPKAAPFDLASCLDPSDCDGAPPSKQTVGGTVATTVSEAEVLKAKQYLASIPTRLEQNSIGHKKKSRPGDFHVRRSRKKQYQAKCAITRSGVSIYHAKTPTATRMKAFLCLPGVRSRLNALGVRRPQFTEAVPRSMPPIREVACPIGIEKIAECKIPEGLRFPDVGDFGFCLCIGDCFIDSCMNAISSIYCTPEFCILGAACSNAPRTRDTLKLFDTGSVGLGVYTTTDLDVGDILGEYAGQLCEYSAKVEGQPEQALKTNSGYTILYYTKSVNKKYVYIEAKSCGSVTRFISHACVPNADFIEMRNGTNVKILVVMRENVKEGAETTVNYGKEIWFTCTCLACLSLAKQAKRVRHKQIETIAAA